ncbi:MAG: hypothetical protein AW10_01134 [Candidatus Accumulibacter appositus]|uniref:Class I SAM-dependent methyltransferase n=1 Tax=Candidatus Accumulibacter appositus TaxID=1454003 RepID=A0A011PX45_9PROT|nr:class I SAM-dependent methyltransferase [Accumulibacter sp.]EXI81597.1 MAG: hypothetical protein AW10_01134 [Candidatus Accumulibacter appositus]HRF06841.1 class I SAM-dependent methyltransferase [Accumulibacter sp.]
MSSSPDSNWDAYYGNADFTTPEFIDNALWDAYSAVIKKHIDGNQTGLVIVELGGANSCFYQRFKKEFSIGEYHIIDSNRMGHALFPYKQDNGVHLYELDLLHAKLESLNISADIVFSGGLIEHFSPDDTKQVIECHFELARPGGLVLMSFPTPTWIYWAFRHFLEKIGKFPPLFERPLREEEVLKTANRLGSTLESFKIWRTILTQLVTLTRKA